METKHNGVDKSITHCMVKNKIDAMNESDKPQASQIKKDKSISNESNKGVSWDKSSSLGKSRDSQITEIEDTVLKINKLRSIPSESLYDNSTNIE